MIKKGYTKTSMLSGFIFILIFIPSITWAGVTLTAGNGSGYKGSRNNQVQVSLDNPNDKARTIIVSICDVDNYLDANSIIDCETTSRASSYACGVYNNISNCTKVYLNPQNGGLISQGSGAIFTLHYDVSAGAPSGECRNLNLQSITVTDENQDLLSVTPVAGSFCYNSCGTNPDCDDSLYCTGSDTCGSGICYPGTDPCPGTECNQCNETDDSCVDPYTVNEGECKKDGSDWIYTPTKCPATCKDGACWKNEFISTKCVDSDGGKKTSIKGAATSTTTYSNGTSESKSKEV